MTLLNKSFKIAITGAMATCLAFTMGTSTYADEDISAKQIESEAAVNLSAETDVSEVDVEDLPQVEEKEETPSLVPGDFFYFVKLMTEKVRLALTVDDYKEAKLLAGFAAERIAEANALLAEGKEEEAADLLQQAINTQEEAEVKLSEDSTEAVDTMSTKLEENEVALTSEDVMTEPDKNIEVDAENETETDEVKVKLANNITALTTALAHVDNPTAQQALMKNIQKSFTKLEKKIEKRSEKKAAKEVEVEEKEASDLEVEAEASSNDAEEIAIEENKTSSEEGITQVTKNEIKNVEKKQQVVKKVQEKKEAAVNKSQQKQEAAKEKVQKKKEEVQVKKQEVQKKQNNKKLSDKE